MLGYCPCYCNSRSPNVISAIERKLHSAQSSFQHNTTHEIPAKYFVLSRLDIILLFVVFVVYLVFLKKKKTTTKQKQTKQTNKNPHRINTLTICFACWKGNEAYLTIKFYNSLLASSLLSYWVGNTSTRFTLSWCYIGGWVRQVGHVREADESDGLQNFSCPIPTEKRLLQLHVPMSSQ